jgi:trehalose 6-phosphate phosphatase
MTSGTGQRAPPLMAPFEIDELALFLDFDGTLAPIAPTPDQIVLDSRVRDLLPRLIRRLGGRVAIVSGRSIANIDRILGKRIMAAAGVHGLERRTASGVRMDVAAHPEVPYARAEFLRLAEAQPGLLVEDKGIGIALHYRGVPEAADAVHGFGSRVAASTGLTLQEGNMVVELRTPGPDKGSAVLAFMAEPPFIGTRPVFVGDDLTDEDAFAAAKASGGFGIQVGSERRTAAIHRLPDVEAVLAWLQAFAP